VAGKTILCNTQKQYELLSVLQHANYADLNLCAMRTLDPIISASRRCPWCLWLSALGTPDV